MKKLLLVAIISAFFGYQPTARAYILVEDIPGLIKTTIDQVVNYAKYLETTLNQLTQISQGVTQITNQVTALTRFGNPNYYIGLLHLNDFMASASELTNGLGQTISSYRQTANGVMALQYTGQGLYSNLQGTLDRFGNVVQYTPDAFRKFGAVSDMVESYNVQQRTFNTQMASLQQQLTTALQNLNSDSTQMGTAKYSAQVSAIHAQMNALTANSMLAGQRLQAQHIANQNDAARTLEATREQLIQERQTDLANEARQFGAFIGGTVDHAAAP